MAYMIFYSEREYSDCLRTVEEIESIDKARGIYNSGMRLNVIQGAPFSTIAFSLFARCYCNLQLGQFDKIIAVGQQVRSEFSGEPYSDCYGTLALLL